MRKRRLGPTGREVGAIGLGCMGMNFAYGPGDRDDEQSVAVVRRAVELGATLIDTADVYGPHTNETLVGRAVRGLREQITLASKAGLIIRDGEIVPDGRPEHLREACDASLQRMGVDSVDLYLLHRVDPTVPLEESWGALAELVEAGKVGHLGISEATAHQLDTVHAIHPVAAVQSELSLWSQDQLAEIVPWCADHQAAFIAYAPLGRGFLTGAITSAGQLEDGDWRTGNPRFQADAVAANQKLARAVGEAAERYGATPAQVALAWVLGTAEHVIPIPGTKHMSYLEDNVRAAALDLSPEDSVALGRLADSVVGTRY